MSFLTNVLNPKVTLFLTQAHIRFLFGQFQRIVTRTLGELLIA